MCVVCNRRVKLMLLWSQTPFNHTEYCIFTKCLENNALDLPFFLSLPHKWLYFKGCL